MISVNKESIRKILTEYRSMKKVCAKMVHKRLMDEQKQKRVVCIHLLEQNGQEANLLDSVITGDESCVFHYNPETKRQILQWTVDQKMQVSRSKVKMFLFVLFYLFEWVGLGFLIFCFCFCFVFCCFLFFVGFYFLL